MTVRIGVIGAGFFATYVHIPVLASRDDVVLQSVCRLGQDELEQVRSTFGFRHASEDWLEVLDQDLDAVVIASPHARHYEQAKAALEKGLHVLVEKPMCLDPHQAWDLVATADRLKRHVVVSNGWHYKPDIARAREMARLIGDVEFVLCHMASPTRVIFEGETPRLRNWENAMFLPARATWQDASSGGGFAFGQLSHSLALLFWITDLRAASVRADLYCREGGVDLHDAAIVRFTNGGLGTVSGSCGLPEGNRFEVDIRLYGRAGELSLDLDRERLVLRPSGGGEEAVPVVPGQWTYSCEGPANALVDLARGAGVNASPAEMGARTVEAIHALIESASADGALASVDTSLGTTA